MPTPFHRAVDQRIQNCERVQHDDDELVVVVLLVDVSLSTIVVAVGNGMDRKGR